MSNWSNDVINAQHISSESELNGETVSAACLLSELQASNKGTCLGILDWDAGARGCDTSFVSGNLQL